LLAVEQVVVLMVVIRLVAVEQVDILQVHH
jgi:hypothetical protein